MGNLVRLQDVIHFEVHGRFERLITQMYFPKSYCNKDVVILEMIPQGRARGCIAVNSSNIGADSGEATSSSASPQSKRNFQL